MQSEETVNAQDPVSTGAQTSVEMLDQTPTSVAQDLGAESSKAEPAPASTSESQANAAPDNELPVDNTAPPNEPAPEAPASKDMPSEELQSEPTPASAIWYYVGTQDYAVVSNILSSDQDIPITSGVSLEGISNRTDLKVNNVPWSPDGSQLAQLAQGEVVFYELEETATITARYMAPQYAEVLVWIPGFGPLLSGERDSVPVLGAMAADGTEFVLGEGSTNAAPYRVSVSPNGQHVLWSTDSEDGGYNIWRTTFDDGQAGEPQLLASYMGSPMLNASWSPHNDWMAFGIVGEGPEGGVYLWGPGTLDPVKVSLEGNEYAPYFEFSPDGSSFAMSLSQDGAGTLSALSIGAYGLGDTQLIDTGTYPDLVEWAGYGRQVLYGVDGNGRLLQLDSHAMSTNTVAFPDFTYGVCNLAWLSETELLYNGCSNMTGVIHGVIADGIMTTTELVPSASNYLALSPGKTCLINWSDEEIYVGPASVEDFKQQQVTTMGGTLTHVAFTPDGSNIVWTEDGVMQYRLELKDCAPSGAPINIRGVSDVIYDTTFVTPENR